jgi:hypothetical protein
MLNSNIRIRENVSLRKEKECCLRYISSSRNRKEYNQLSKTVNYYSGKKKSNSCRKHAIVDYSYSCYIFWICFNWYMVIHRLRSVLKQNTKNDIYIVFNVLIDI